jgi:hypothetical protein
MKPKYDSTHFIARAEALRDASQIADGYTRKLIRMNMRVAARSFRTMKLIEDAIAGK